MDLYETKPWYSVSSEFFFFNGGSLRKKERHSGSCWCFFRLFASYIRDVTLFVQSFANWTELKSDKGGCQATLLALQSWDFFTFFCPFFSLFSVGDLHYSSLWLRYRHRDITRVCRCRDFLMLPHVEALECRISDI